MYLIISNIYNNCGKEKDLMVFNNYSVKFLLCNYASLLDLTINDFFLYNVYAVSKVLTLQEHDSRHKNVVYFVEGTVKNNNISIYDRLVLQFSSGPYSPSG